MQRLMFITYVDIEEQRRDEGLRYAVYLAHRTEALALRTGQMGQIKGPVCPARTGPLEGPNFPSNSDNSSIQRWTVGRH